MSELQQKVALVTGGSSGIGRAIALRLARDGAHVYVHYSKSQDNAERVQKEVEEAGGSAGVVQADVTEEAQVVDMMQQIKKVHGGLDILVNNAGIDIEAEIEHCEYDLWRRILDTNLTGKFLCIKHATPLLKKTTGGVIVNIASRMGTRPCQDIIPYCVSQAGIIMLTKGSALELAKYNIRVNAVSPGLTRTPMTEALCEESVFTGYQERNPLKRLGMPEDIAGAVAFLSSDAAAFITGENIDVSGGILLK
ncbi:MAG: beta-ketoacyl-ACP reductase [Candidatus Magasanikbacteria bacterium CG10_big_fil_rev_8_21_14_0_10_43_6]|uniref:Beta-ketoacyl-ACP reductase n=1 Tax=Candidatus Magasanikbacteria bacterium CG10_big_fil_rev_8_21_14_0_10_43_6 TaxID=1974650 RepID=A0A2M6W1U2_9BACT|nr:MAG: beta-ketoacyl-ACP reductase [Candidatus Magasanikbacteria bacterium CG10_big_fil_rev_8_21_14_0_10_43_6]